MARTYDEHDVGSAPLTCLCRPSSCNCARAVDESDSSGPVFSVELGCLACIQSSRLTGVVQLEQQREELGSVGPMQKRKG